jgi:hypothetical protein
MNAVPDRPGARYVLYALGEVLLIFIGITLAIGFENPAEQRRQEDLTDGLLLGVRGDLEANIAELEANIELDEDFIASLNTVIHRLDTSSEWDDSMSVQLENALHWSSPFLATSGYDGLRQAGLYQVRDEELRRSIVDLYERTYGFLVGDHDRNMWVFMESALNPVFVGELVRTDDGNTARGRVAPRDYAATRERGVLRSVLLEQQGHLINGLDYRHEALEGTAALLARIDAAVAGGA